MSAELWLLQPPSNMEYVDPWPELKARLDRLEYKMDLILETLERPKHQQDTTPFQYDAEFEQLWSQYPKRAGSNPKRAACRALRARLTEGVPLDSIRQGLTRYTAFCVATGKLGTETVMQGARFFGPGEEWANEWVIPVVKKEPLTDDDWLRRGQELGIAPKPGESMKAFIGRVRSQ